MIEIYRPLKHIPMTQISDNFRPIIDELGEVKAKIEELEFREKELRDQVAALGAGNYDGTKYRVIVSLSERSTLDMAAVREKLSPQFIAKHTKRVPVTTVRAVALASEAV